MVLITNNKTINEQWIEMNLLAKERESKWYSQP
jgi:hypothetical protein